MDSAIHSALRASKYGLFLNLLLAIGKIIAGILGNAYALVADGIESSADVFSSFIVWGGLRIALKPADQDHPYGHGRAEQVAGLVVGLMLLGAAILIAILSVHEIQTPHTSPRWWTLIVLVIVIVIKQWLHRRTGSAAEDVGSTALKGDALHHQSDLLTSAAAFIGITIGLIGGKGYESADDWGALLACGVIAWNGFKLIRDVMAEIMDTSPPMVVVSEIRDIATHIDGVTGVGKCRMRKIGLHMALDIHVKVDGNISVTEGHSIAHAVEAQLKSSKHRIGDVTVHIEPESRIT